MTTHPDRKHAVAQSYPQARIVPDMAAVRDAGARGVTISTPPETHRGLALQAIDLGLHVVIDKPVALTEPQVQEIADAARAAGVQAIPYFNRRWDDDFLTIQRLHADGTLGHIHRYESRLDRSRPVKPGWPNDVQRGGGLLLDLGPHLIDQALTLLGPARAVTAHLRAVRRGAAAEDTFHLVIDHVAGARSVLSASLASPAPGPRFLLQGSAAGLRVEGFDVQEAQLKAGQSPASLGSGWGRQEERHVVISPREGKDRTAALAPGAWDTFYPAVAEAMDGGAAAPTSIDDAMSVARIIDAARRSDGNACTLEALALH